MHIHEYHPGRCFIRSWNIDQKLSDCKIVYSYFNYYQSFRLSKCTGAGWNFVGVFIHSCCLFGVFFSLYNFVSAGDARIKWKCFMFGFMQGLNPSLRVWNHFFIAVLKSKTGWKKKQILKRSRGFPNKAKKNFLPWFQMLFIPELSMVWETQIVFLRLR